MYGDGLYSLNFDTSRYASIQNGGKVIVQVYFGNQLRSTAELVITRPAE